MIEFIWRSDGNIMDKLSKFPYSVWLLRALASLLPQNKYRGIPGTAVFFHGKYRGRNFEYRPSVIHRTVESYRNT